MIRKPSLIQSLGRSQIAAVAATLADFGVLVVLTELAGLYYVWSTAIAAMTGAAISFLLGRFWAFRAPEGDWFLQAAKYALVSVGSLILNSAGVFIFTEYAYLPYALSKAVTALFVGLTYNFLLHRYFVFKK